MKTLNFTFDLNPLLCILALCFLTQVGLAQPCSDNILTDQDISVSFSFDFEDLETDCSEEQIFTIEFFSVGQCGETAECQTELIIVPESRVYIPNTISLSAQDPTDKTFAVFGNTAAPELWSVEVFDRWGSSIWSTDDLRVNDISTGWSPASDVNLGVYLYQLRPLGSEDMV